MTKVKRVVLSGPIVRGIGNNKIKSLVLPVDPAPDGEPMANLDYATWAAERHARVPVEQSAIQAKADRMEGRCFPFTGKSGPYLVSPPFLPGDILWVSETWRRSAPGEFDDFHGLMYAADFKGEEGEWGPWRPSTSMPKTACRHFLEVAGVTMKRAKTITEEECRAFGVEYFPREYAFACWGFDGTVTTDPNSSTPHAAFKTELDRLRPGAWGDNAYVFIVSFKRTGKPEGWPA